MKTTKKILSEHFHHLFKSHAQVDPTVLNKLQQHQAAHEVGHPPTFNEVKSAITSMHLTKPLDRIEYDKKPS